MCSAVLDLEKVLVLDFENNILLGHVLGRCLVKRQILTPINFLNV